MTVWTDLDAYASRTGTKRNLAALRAAGWGLFVSAAGVHRSEGFRFIIDNGAATIDTILLVAADAAAGEVFEVQTDAGLYELVGGEWVFKPWERLESET